MKHVSMIVLLLLLALIVGGSVFLVTWDILPSVAKIEKVIPDERFPR
jgi:hypothetical protein